MSRPLKMFMRGKSVRTLQQMLRQMGYPMEDQPAIFGASTRDGVKDFQKRKGVKVSGIVDDELLELMRQSVGFQAERAAKKEPTVNIADSDETKVDALIRLLVSKGVISEAELAETVGTKTVKPTGEPLF